MELIQALIPLGLSAVNDFLQQEVKSLTGERYARERPFPARVRWGTQRSSVYLSDQKLPVMVPRSLDQGLFRRVLKGISCLDYKEWAEATPEAFGMSGSTVSRRFIRASAKKLKELLGRDLSGHDFVVLVLDGKAFAQDEMVIALGITAMGEKVILGFVQTATENEKSCAELLRELVERGLRHEEGFLVILDGAKGLKKAIQQVMGYRHLPRLKDALKKTIMEKETQKMKKAA